MSRFSSSKLASAGVVNPAKELGRKIIEVYSVESENVTLRNLEYVCTRVKPDAAKDLLWGAFNQSKDGSTLQREIFKKILAYEDGAPLVTIMGESAVSKETEVSVALLQIEVEIKNLRRYAAALKKKRELQTQVTAKIPTTTVAPAAAALGGSVATPKSRQLITIEMRQLMERFIKRYSPSSVETVVATQMSLLPSGVGETKAP